MEGFENIKETRINAVKIKATPSWDPALQTGLGGRPIGETLGVFLYYEYEYVCWLYDSAQCEWVELKKTKQPNFSQSKNPPGGAALFNKGDVILTRASV